MTDVCESKIKKNLVKPLFAHLCSTEPVDVSGNFLWRGSIKAQYLAAILLNKLIVWFARLIINCFFYLFPGLSGKKYVLYFVNIKCVVFANKNQSMSIENLYVKTQQVNEPLSAVILALSINRQYLNVF